MFCTSPRYPTYLIRASASYLAAQLVLRIGAVKFSGVPALTHDQELHREARESGVPS